MSFQILDKCSAPYQQQGLGITHAFFLLLLRKPDKSKLTSAGILRHPITSCLGFFHVAFLFVFLYCFFYLFIYTCLLFIDFCSFCLAIHDTLVHLAACTLPLFSLILSVIFNSGKAWRKSYAWWHPKSPKRMMMIIVVGIRWKWWKWNCRRSG